MPQPCLGVCYYPEHWPQERWPADAEAMSALGIRRVRIGEFAWAQLEPEPGNFQWTWLDRALQTLTDAGLEVIMGTPTACPPKWLVDQYPEVLPHAAEGHPRGFGSRRHYCFGSERYSELAAQLVERLAARYGSHPGIVGWQLDNEYGCHATTLIYSPGALPAFRGWLETRYGDIETLNAAWGTGFWSQRYRSFAEVDWPAATVTEANPAQRLDHWRFSSAQVARFNQQQANIIRAAVPDGVWVTHNFMGNFSEFDHFAVAADLDLASWDSYPLGFLDGGWFSPQEKQRFRQTGHPDWAAFHHELYRAAGRGRFAVMEQQPGPVNWAQHNAAPLPGMVRLWTWEALAHGAEFVSYFRWRQLPRAQEQMHAGLRLVDDSPAPGAAEVAEVAAELAAVSLPPRSRAAVALVVDYTALAMLQIQPHGADAEPLAHSFAVFSALRGLGLEVDMVPVDAPLAGYRLVAVPCWPALSARWVEQASASGAQILVGARSGSRTEALALPARLPPGPLQAVLPLAVVAVDALRDDSLLDVTRDGRRVGQATGWLEQLRTELAPLAAAADGRGVWYSAGPWHYLATRPDGQLLTEVLTELAANAGLRTQRLAAGLRYQQRGNWQFAFNYGPGAAQLDVPAATCQFGTPQLAPGELAAWRVPE